MCGIAGIIGNKVEVSKLEFLTDKLKHRGPDETNVWISENRTIGLGHQRLSILDLSPTGSQPMKSSNHELIIVFNGEIFNFIELQQELEAYGYKFESKSDTEVVLAAYDKWGEQMLNKFNGMWAMAIANTKTDELFFARDRFGIKPFYYAQTDTELLFASEVQALHKYLGNQWPLNSNVINDILNGGFINHGTSETYLQNVNSLPAGHFALYKNGSLTINKWYTLEKRDVSQHRKNQAEELRSLIADACRLRLRSDVPIATCLSGGVDSTTITAFIQQPGITDNARFTHYTHRAFNLSLPNSEIDESKTAQDFIKQINGKLDIVNLSTIDPIKLESVMRKMDGPMHALAFYPIYMLYENIKGQGIKVTLDGQGPDEMLGGYSPVFEAFKTAAVLWDPFWFNDIYKTYSAQGELTYSSAKRAVKNELKRFLQYKKIQADQRVKWPIKYVLSKFGLYSFQKNKKERPIILQPAIKESYHKLPIDIELFKQFFQAPLPGILNQFDRCSMANGVECRMPFMDYRIVEFVFSLPPRSKIGGGYTKRILREAIENIVPDSIRLKKEKIGFNAPMIEWFRGPLKNWLIEISQSQEFIENSYFSSEEIKTKLYNFIESDKPTWGDAWKLWPYFHFAWWLKYIQSWEE